MAKYKQNIFLALTALIALILAALFISFGLRATIIADDYAYFNRFNRFGSVAGYLNYHYSLHNGRIGQATFFAVFYAIFGVHTLVVTPIFLYLATGLVVALYINRFLKFQNYQWAHSLAVSFVLLPCALFAARSMYDSYLWLTSSTVYMGGLIFVLLALYLAWMAATSSRNMWGWTALVLVASVFAGAFTEPLTINAGMVTAALAVLSFIRKKYRAGIIWVVAWVGLVAAFLIIYSSPGTAKRREHNRVANVSILETTGEVPKYLGKLYYSTPWWSILLLLCLGLATYFALSKTCRQKFKLIKVLGSAIAIYLIFVPAHLIVSLLGSPNYIAMRTYTVPTFFTIFTLFAVMLCVGNLCERYVPGLRFLALSAYGLVAVIAAFPIAHYTGVVHDALVMRAEHLQARAQSVEEQRAAGAEKIVLTPVPVMLDGEATDFIPGTQKQTSWVMKEIPEWYGITDTQNVVIDKLPDGYCVPDDTAEHLVKKWAVCGNQ